MANELKLKSQLESIGDFFSAHSPADREDASTLLAELLPLALPGYELILGEGETATGILLKGNGQEFWALPAKIMREKGAPESTQKAVQDLSAAAEFRNGYCKLEWPGKNARPGQKAKISVYFRRRFALEEANQFLVGQGIGEEVRERLGLYAELFQKSRLHFLALSAEEGKPLAWKAYFTQWVDRVSYAKVLRRVITMMELQSVSPDTAGLLISAHSRLMPYGKDQTLFISLSFSDSEIKPEVKLDYPAVDPNAIMHLISPERREAEYALIQNLVGQTGGGNLSYLGVRLQQQQGLQLKYYSDTPGF